MPLLRLPAVTLGALHRALAQDRSPEDAARLARELGFETGEPFYRALQGWLADRVGDRPADSLPADQFWQQLEDFFDAFGWGALRFEPLHEGVASLWCDHWVEAEMAGPGPQPTCHVTTGMLADLLSRVAGTDLAVMEVECRSRGDGQCRFLLGSPEVLQRIYERLRQGAGYAEAVSELG